MWVSEDDNFWRHSEAMPSEATGADSDLLIGEQASIDTASSSSLNN